MLHELVLPDAREIIALAAGARRPWMEIVEVGVEAVDVAEFRFREGGHALDSAGSLGCSASALTERLRDNDRMALDFRPGRSDEPPGSELLDELIAFFNEIYPGRAARPGSVTTPDEMAPPTGAFLVGYEDGRPVAIGGVRRLEDSICEIKRMYVVADARSRGVGRALLTALEEAARELGYERARVDAGPRQTDSRALFARTGYVDIPKYNDNHIADYFAEKLL